MRGLIVVKHAPLAQTKDTHSVSFYSEVTLGHGKPRNRRVNPGPQDANLRKNSNVNVMFHGQLMRESFEKRCK